MTDMTRFVCIIPSSSLYVRAHGRVCCKSPSCSSWGSCVEAGADLSRNIKTLTGRPERQTGLPLQDAEIQLTWASLGAMRPVERLFLDNLQRAHRIKSPLSFGGAV